MLIVSIFMNKSQIKEKKRKMKLYHILALYKLHGIVSRIYNAHIPNHISKESISGFFFFYYGEKKILLDMVYKVHHIFCCTMHEHIHFHKVLNKKDNSNNQFSNFKEKKKGMKKKKTFEHGPSQL